MTDAGQRLIGSLRLIASTYCGNWMGEAAAESIREIERLRGVEDDAAEVSRILKYVCGEIAACERDHVSAGAYSLRHWRALLENADAVVSRSTGAADVGEESKPSGGIVGNG